MPRGPGWGWCLLVPAGLAYLVAFNAHFGFRNDLVSASLGKAALPEAEQPAGLLGTLIQEGPERVPAVARALGQRLLNMDQGRLLLLVFLALTVVQARRAFRGKLRAPALGLLFALLGYVCVYLGTPRDLERHLATSMGRVLFHLYPAAGLWIGLWLAEVLPAIRATHGDRKSKAGDLGSGSL
jgi:hypothetical protein